MDANHGTRLKMTSRRTPVSPHASPRFVLFLQLLLPGLFAIGPPAAASDRSIYVTYAIASDKITERSSSDGAILGTLSTTYQTGNVTNFPKIVNVAGDRLRGRYLCGLR